MTTASTLVDYSGGVCLRCYRNGTPNYAGHTYTKCKDIEHSVCPRCGQLGHTDKLPVPCTRNIPGKGQKPKLCWLCSGEHWAFECSTLQTWESKNNVCITCGGDHKYASCPEAARRKEVSQDIRFKNDMSKLVHGLLELDDAQAKIGPVLWKIVLGLFPSVSGKTSRDDSSALHPSETSSVSAPPRTSS